MAIGAVRSPTPTTSSTGFEHEPEERVVVEVVRGQETLAIEVTLGTRAFPSAER